MNSNITPSSHPVIPIIPIQAVGPLTVIALDVDDFSIAASYALLSISRLSSDTSLSVPELPQTDRVETAPQKEDPIERVWIVAKKIDGVWVPQR